MAEPRIRGITTPEANAASPMARKILIDLGLDNHPKREAMQQRLLEAIVAVRRVSAQLKRTP